MKKLLYLGRFSKTCVILELQILAQAFLRPIRLTKKNSLKALCVNLRKLYKSSGSIINQNSSF